MSAQIALRLALLGTVDEFLGGGRAVDFGQPVELQATLVEIITRRLLEAGHSPLDLCKELEKLTYVHLKGVFSVEGLPETPNGFYPIPDCRSTVAARLVAISLGGFFAKRMISYGSENEGELFVNLVALEGGGAVSKNSTKAMRGHTDAASFPFPGGVDPTSTRIAPSPDVVCLMGLKNADSVSTTLMLLHELMSDLTADDIAQLSKPQFLIGCQRTFARGTKHVFGDEHYADGANVLEARSGGQVWVRYSHSSVTVAGDATDDQSVSNDVIAERSPAAAAKNRFEEACVSRARRVVINPGDVLWVNNRQALHGRTVVDHEVGGSARWLLRGYALDPTVIRREQYYEESEFKLYP
ncbi:hypothetical protein [Burkholderia sp. LMU1-1-1.1]|uniref:hypothetical protein n=1 Tax=Burkholderia sp. LMU1-1-1.1 TaxID=3135266 RepID=UPI00343074D4